MTIRVFWLEPTNLYRHGLRRFAHDTNCASKPYGMGCHDARVDLETVEAREHPTSHSARADGDSCGAIAKNDPRWPASCVCGYAFAPGDGWQENFDNLYRATGGGRDGELWTLRDAPPGAMWDAEWMKSDMCTGPDGITLVVKTPGGDWLVDSEASNCTRTQWAPSEGGGKTWTGRTHYCWIRHGDPRKPETLHVDKNGNTCAAGAGSIQAGSYHGFLHHGELTP